MISKKTLIAAAVLSTMAAGAMAANVTLYGKIDDSFKYERVKETGKSAANSFSMDSGIAGGSRWGIKGVEELGNGYKVNFVLEGGLKSDTGALNTNNTIFDRQASLGLVTPYGSFQFGRMGTITGGTNGGMMDGQMSPFGYVYGNAKTTAIFWNNLSRVDNAVRYDTPKFAGFQAAVQYSLAKGTENAQSAKNERYAGAVVKYNNGNLNVVAGVDTVKFAEPTAVQDAQSAKIAANYNFGVAKVFAGYQHVKHAAGLKIAGVTGLKDSNAYTLGVSAPVCGGSLMGVLGYQEGSTDKQDVDTYQAGLAYKYSLSKRTFLFTGVTYLQQDKDNGKATTKTKTTQAFVGLDHSF